MLELISEHGCFGGAQCSYRHDSAEIGLSMRFLVYLPPAARERKVPALSMPVMIKGTTSSRRSWPPITSSIMRILRNP